MFYRGKKRSKKEPDAFQKTFAGFLEQIRGSGMLLVVLLVSILVIMAVVWVAASRRASRESAAQVKLAAALEQPNVAEREAALRKLIEENAGDRAEALALLADSALRHSEALKPGDGQQGRREEEFKAILAQLDGFMTKHPRDILMPRFLERRALVLEDLALTLDTVGNTEEATKARGEAVEAFDQAIKMVAGTDLAYLRGKLLYGRARCEEKLKQRDKAVQTLEVALGGDAENRGEPWRSSAVTLLAQLRPAAKDLRVQGAAQDEPPPPAAAPPKPSTPPAPGKSNP